MDDDAKQRSALGRALVTYHVTPSHSGKDAQRILADDGAFDAVLCDLTMEDGNGLELLDWVKEHRPELGPRVVFLTGASVRGPVGRFLAKSPHPVLEKPVSIPELHKTLDAIVRGST